MNFCKDFPNFSIEVSWHFCKYSSAQNNPSLQYRISVYSISLIHTLINWDDRAKNYKFPLMMMILPDFLWSHLSNTHLVLASITPLNWSVCCYLLTWIDQPYGKVGRPWCPLLLGRVARRGKEIELASSNLYHHVGCGEEHSRLLWVSEVACCDTVLPF